MVALQQAWQHAHVLSIWLMVACSQRPFQTTSLSIFPLTASNPNTHFDKPEPCHLADGVTAPKQGLCVP